MNLTLLILLALTGCAIAPNLNPSNESPSTGRAENVWHWSGQSVVQPSASIAIATTNINLHWSASTNAEVGGYYIYYGTSKGNFSDKVECGADTNGTVPNLPCGHTYYFQVATRADHSGLWTESDLHEETIPSPLYIVVMKDTSASVNVPMRFDLHFSSGAQLQSSRDGKKWSARAGIFDNGVWHVTASNNVPREYFRTQ